MLQLLSVPLKKPTAVDVVKPLNNLIQSTYNGSTDEEKAKYTEAVNDFSKQRNLAIWKFFEKYESSLELVYAYYDQLCALETKISVNELQIPFKWKDAFDKGSIFGGRISLTHTSLQYEKVCVLFNIAALQSCIAAEQPLDTDDNLKYTIKLLQQSAGNFQYLRGAVPAAIPSEPTPDLNQDALLCLQALMVAQAQEVFIQKTIKDNVKENIIARLCCQCEEFYSDVLKAMQKESVRTIWEKEWLPLIAGKQAGYHAMTQLYQSIVCRTEKKIGEEIARLQSAVELFKAAQTRSNNSTFLDDYFNRAKRHLSESTKDNEFIYNEVIPDIKTLQLPARAQLAKPIAFSLPLSTNFKDIFHLLIPVELHRALTASESRKSELINAEIMKLRESTQTLNAVLTSLNLPAAIESLDNDSNLPPSLQEKADNVRRLGGMDTIEKYLKELPELLERNREILDESDRLLDEEGESDDQLRSQFKEKWTRIPSKTLAETFRVNAKKYRSVITKAVDADKFVRNKVESNEKYIKLLSLPLDELKEAIPSNSGSIDPNCPSVLKLKQLMEEVEKIKTERDAIEYELKASSTFDMKDEFMQALQNDGAINEPSLSLSCIGKVLSPLQAQVKESIERQQTLTSDIQTAHNEFTRQTGGAGSDSRDKICRELASAYDNFNDLISNLKEGTKFYNDLTELLVVFQNKISDFCFARKTEKEELLKDLTKESSRQTAGPTPSLPSHYSSTSGSGTDISAMSTGSAPSPATVPYPQTIQGMPMPYAIPPNLPYANTYAPPPMPQGFNPYATLPYPGAYGGAAASYQPTANNPYGTYPGSQQPKPYGW